MMLKKIWYVFARDVRISLRDFMGALLLVFPILVGVAINFLAPSVNDTTTSLALLESESPALVASLEQFARVELFEDEDAIVERLEKRDNMVAILPEGEGHYILTQGNEPEEVVELAKLLHSFAQMELRVEDTSATIETFGRTEPPLKKMLVNLAILMTSVMGGMIVAVNIVEEKADKTIAAMNVTTLSRSAFILGKSVIGVFLATYGTVAIVLITGYGDVSIGQMLLTILAVSILSILVGFIQGILNDDVMNAAGGIKLLFLPLAAAVAAAELLSDKWQFLAYWIPYYWTYKGNDAILSYSADWAQIVLYTAIVLVLSGVVYYVLAPRIRKGLA